MDASEATQLVFARVQALDPDNVSKIIGYFLLQDHGAQEMMSLALGPDSLLRSAVAKAKRELVSPQNGQQILPPQIVSRSQFSLPISGTEISKPIQNLAPRWPDFHSPGFRPAALYIPEKFPVPNSYSPSGMTHEQILLQDKIADLHKQKLEAIQNQPFGQDLLGLHERIGLMGDSTEVQGSPTGMFSNEWLFGDSPSPTFYGKSVSTKRNGLDLANALSWKPCLYYSRGYCKHGNNCRFLHSPLRESSPSASSSGQQDLFINESLSCGSLERLELELQELLRGRRAPVSIASLPQLYYERFGKTLQAEGYLTESQRHGKAGYSLTKLLARLKNTVTLIDRPHGQHAVVLAEDAQRFTAYRSDRDDLKDVNPSSRQIYLTFPAESTFTEEDVSAHFRAYGPVQDVRIPYQQKRMFGFVTFVYPDTVKTILSEGNPHYICGARVLVKPYREKAKPNERKHPEKGDFLRYSQNRSLSLNDYVQGVNFSENNQFARQLDDEEQLFDLERRRILDLHEAEVQRVQMEAEAALLDAITNQAQHANVGASSSQVNGQEQDHKLHGHYESEQVLSNVFQTEQVLGNTYQTEQMMTNDEIQQFQSDNAFGFVLDVLDGENGETEAGPVSDNTKAEQANGELSNGHNLPDNLFATPHSYSDSKVVALSDTMMGFSLSARIGHETSNALAAVLENELTCCICMGYLVDPIKLDCTHTFCVQCILKVVQKSKDECPICRHHIGSQIYKILQRRDLQSWLSPSISQRAVVQGIW